MVNPNVISFDVDTLPVKNGIYKDFSSIQNLLEVPVTIFKGCVLAWIVNEPTYGTGWYIFNSGDPYLSNPRGILAETIVVDPGDFFKGRVLIGGEIYADRVLFQDPDQDNLFTIPPGKDEPVIITLKRFGITVRFGYNITENDFPACAV